MTRWLNHFALAGFYRDDSASRPEPAAREIGSFFGVKNLTLEQARDGRAIRIKGVGSVMMSRGINCTSPKGVEPVTSSPRFSHGPRAGQRLKSPPGLKRAFDIELNLGFSARRRCPKPKGWSYPELGSDN